MRYFVKWLWKEPSLVLTEEGKLQKVKEREKKDFVNGLKPGDQVYLEFGGAGDRLALSLTRKGVEVFRIPTFVLKQKRTDFGTDRKDDVLLVKRIADESSNSFYPIRPVDRKILELKYLVRSFYVIQGLRKVVDQRLWQVMQDLLLLEKPDQDMEVEVKTRIKNLGVSAGVHEQEKQLRKKIEKLLSEIPVYSVVFKPIYGCGPLISGRFIGEIGDIRRFASAADLKAYCGYHLKDGEVPKRRKGEPSRWNPNLKQAVWLFLDQINRHEPNDCQWKELLLKRKAYERKLHPEPVVINKNGKLIKIYTDGHVHVRALRYVGGKFLEYIYREWKRFEQGGN